MRSLIKLKDNNFYLLSCNNDLDRTITLIKDRFNNWTWSETTPSLDHINKLLHTFIQYKHEPLDNYYPFELADLEVEPSDYYIVIDTEKGYIYVKSLKPLLPDSTAFRTVKSPYAFDPETLIATIEL